jgi:hypothetical protein
MSGLSFIGPALTSAANTFEEWTPAKLHSLRARIGAHLAADMRMRGRVARNHPRQHHVDLYQDGVSPRWDDRCTSSWDFARDRGTRVRLRVEDFARGFLYVEVHPYQHEGEPRLFSCLASEAAEVTAWIGRVLLGRASWRGAPLGMRELQGETAARWHARFTRREHSPNVERIVASQRVADYLNGAHA